MEINNIHIERRSSRPINHHISFDIKAYLDSKDIHFKTGGKNVSRGWIEINCILPGCADHSEHLGINLKTLKCKCWLCGRKTHALHLIEIIEKCQPKIALMIAKKFSTGLEEDWQWEENQIQTRKREIVFPEEFSNKNWPEIHLEYLKSRGYDPQNIIRDFSLFYSYTAGDYKFRIIIPIFINNVIVSFTGMDILRREDRPKYKDCPPEESIIPVKQCLYNIDNVKNKVAIYEGVTGVWRFGMGSVASFTSSLSQEQILLLLRKKVKEVFVIFDPNAEEKGKEISRSLSGIIPYVEQICFSEGDPKDLTPNKIIDLKRDLKFI